MTETLMGKRKFSLIEYMRLSTARSRFQSVFFKYFNYFMFTDTPVLL